MAHESGHRVPFALETIGQCLCPTCPVQGGSQCVAELKAGMDEALRSNPLKPEKVPGVYCGTGKADCTDIDTNQVCICGDCAVFAQFRLGDARPSSYYCRAGASQ